MSNPSSYIPTTTAAVTRNADVVSMTGTNFSDWYNQSEGAVYVNVSYNTVSAYSTAWGISDGTANNEIRVIGWNDGTDRMLLIADGGVAQVGIQDANSIGYHKYASAIKENDFASSRDGAAVQTDTSGTVPTVDRLHIGSTRGTSFTLNGHIKRLQYYPKRLTNTELQALSA
jgi:hypothetical protein